MWIVVRWWRGDSINPVTTYGCFTDEDLAKRKGREVVRGESGTWLTDTWFQGRNVEVMINRHDIITDAAEVCVYGSIGELINGCA